MRAFWKWLLVVFSRLGDLIVKAISYKGLAASIVTAVYLAAVLPGSAGSVLGLGGFLVVAFMWAMTVSYRYAEKLSALTKKGPE